MTMMTKRQKNVSNEFTTKKLLVFFCISYFDTNVRRKKETHSGREGRY